MFPQKRRYKNVKFRHTEGIWIEGVVTKIDPITFKVDTGSEVLTMRYSDVVADTIEWR